MPITIRDIAKEAGVSIATVSRVINNSDLVTESTKIKVNKIIEEFNFVPSAVARGLSKRQTKTLGVIIPDISNPFFGELISGVAQEANTRGYDIIITNSGNSHEKIYKDVINLQGRDVEGMILSSARIDEKTLDYLRDNNFPFVLTGPVNYRHPINFVTVDNIEGAKLAVKHLINLGHSNIGYINSTEGNYFNNLRYEGYIKALTGQKIRVEENLCFGNDPNVEIDKIKELISQGKLSALFAFNDFTALNYMECLARNNIKIPDDIAIAGFDNIQLASFYSIELTTVDNGQRELGKIAVDILLENVNSDNYKTQQYIKKPELIIRKSCGGE